jgi:hypothetical protein
LLPWDSLESLFYNIGKKTLFISFIFVSLLLIFYSAGILNGIYVNNWQVYKPYLASGSLFWVLIFGAVFSILLNINLGQIKISRNIGLLSFASGILLACISAVFLSTTMHLSIFEIFTKSTTDLTINLGRFFLLSGIALFLMETPFIFRIAGLGSEPLIPKGNFAFKILFGLQFMKGIFFLYMFGAIGLSIGANPSSNTLANLILCYALLIEGIISLGATFFKAWLK